MIPQFITSALQLGAKAIKGVTQKARRRAQAFGKALKEKKLKNAPKHFTEWQDTLKKSDKRFRRYNRKLKVYEPITPRGKIKNSPEYQQFVLDLNEYVNTNLTAQDELKKQAFIAENKISDDVFEQLETSDYDISTYDSDDNEVKGAHIQRALEKYASKIKSGRADLAKELVKNIDRYNIHDIYEMVYNRTENGQLSFEDALINNKDLF